MALADFDIARFSAFFHSVRIGPVKKATMTVNTKAMDTRPGWHYVVMHGDYVATLELSTTDVISAIRELKTQFEEEIADRIKKG